MAFGAAATALIAAVVAYYVVGAAVGSEAGDGSADQIALYSLAALALGPALGATGGAIRHGRLLGLAAALVVPLGIVVEVLWRAAGRSRIRRGRRPTSSSSPWRPRGWRRPRAATR